MKLATKHSEDGVGRLAMVKDEKHPFPDTAHAKEGGFFKENPHKVLFPDSELFRKWGRDLSEAQQKEAEDLFQKFGYNVYLSDQLPLDRTLPDTRDSSVILIFMDEALSVIQRAITSIIQRTPPQLLKEIILVDDFSSNGELKADLDERIKLYNRKSPGLLKIIRHTERRGLAAARNTGREVATADVVAILDAHIEVNVGWAEPILARIQEDRTVIVSPVFDNILFDTFELIQYALAVDGFDWELWCRYDALPKAWVDLHDVTAPVRSPSIMGILAANRLFLEEIGSLDGGMLTYGGENVELSLRMKNTLDERVCLDQGAVPGNTPIMHHCHQYSSQNVYYHLTGELYVGPLIAQRDADDRCLTDPGKGEKPTLEPCSKAVKDRLNIHWDFK
ncbi:hypothetical protein Celaphus_00013892, partial [Cervus elaphus hippelaphus]